MSILPGFIVALNSHGAIPPGFSYYSSIPIQPHPYRPVPPRPRRIPRKGREIYVVTDIRPLKTVAHPMFISDKYYCPREVKKGDAVVLFRW